MPSNNYTAITPNGTTVVSGTAFKRVNLLGIAINKALTGTLVIKTGATTIGTIAATAAAGMYWFCDGGVEIADLQIVSNNAGDDAVVFWNNL